MIPKNQLNKTLLVFFILNMLDLATTLFVVSTYGFESERAGIAKFFLDRFQEWGLIGLKILISISIIVIAKYSQSYKLFSALKVANVIFVLIVLNNLIMSTLILFPQLILLF
jgi:hypothetical protein